jgi:predicted transposase YbfD/YdcC
MEDSTAGGADVGLGAIDVVGLWGRLEELSDARGARGKRYALALVLLLVVLAKLAGEDRPSGIADWVRHRRARLEAALRRAVGAELPHAPHHNTFRRVLAHAVGPGELDGAVGAYLGTRAGEAPLVAIDGKTLKGTANEPVASAAHILAAYVPQTGIVLAQEPTGARENEISVAPALLARLDLRGKVVVGDALHTQRRTAALIRAAGGEYVCVVKANQPALHADIVTLFESDDTTVAGGRLPHDWQTAQQDSRGHGRRETRQVVASAELRGYSDWPDLAQVFRLERSRCRLKTGELARTVVYGATSYAPDAASPSRLLALLRAYWGIENGLHYRRDVTFREDATRATRGHTGHVLASLTNLVIGLLRLAGFTNLAAARRLCDADLSDSCTLLNHPRRT